MFQMLGVFAEFERAMIAERVRAGLRRAKGEGKQVHQWWRGYHIAALQRGHSAYFTLFRRKKASTEPQPYVVGTGEIDPPVGSDGPTCWGIEGTLGGRRQSRWLRTADGFAVSGHIGFFAFPR